MIRKVAYKDIDFEKYQECILNSFNYKIYAENWYLDAVTEKKWDCLIYGDYEFVMPLPFVKRFGVRLISMPILCQQLGIFGKQKDVKIFDLFFAELTKQKVEIYNFNDSNVFSDENVKINSKINQILDLNVDYEDLYSNFKKDRKKDIRRINSIENLEFSIEFKLEEFLHELKKKYPQFKTDFYSTQKFRNLLSELSKHKKIRFVSLKQHENTIATLFLVESKKSLILLLSSKDTSGNFKGAFASIINKVIHEYGKDFSLLDFEGSSIASIHSFNESFGAVIKEYYTFSNFNLHTKVKFFKNLIIKK